MIPEKRPYLLFVWLTFLLLVACEPLAPEQTPRYIVVTGETPQTGGIVAGTPVPDTNFDANSTATAEAVAVVHTPQPSLTPTPTETPMPTETPYRCGETQGTVVSLSFYSFVAGDYVSYLMYQPPCFYDSLQRYPYVLLLHGTGYDENMWVDVGAPAALDTGIAKGTLPPMVLIMPDGGILAEHNDLPVDVSYEAMIMDELLPMLEQDYCLWSSKQGRAIGGISRGGFWSFSIGLRHPDFFGAIGGHSPYFDEDNAAPQYNPLDLVKNVNGTKFPQRIYLDHAESDVVNTNVQLMSSILRERGIAHDYLIDPVGGHDLEYWQAHVTGYLQFYGEQWPRDVMALPSCLVPSPE